MTFAHYPGEKLVDSLKKALAEHPNCGGKLVRFSNAAVSQRQLIEIKAFADSQPERVEPCLEGVVFMDGVIFYSGPHTTQDVMNWAEEQSEKEHNKEGN